MSNFKLKWFCGFFGWHKAGVPIGFDGASNTARCQRCNKPLLQDSQGNWFASGSQDIA